MICAKKHQQPICALDADRGWWPLCDRKEPPITSLYLLRGAKKPSCKATLPIYRMFRFEYLELWFSFIRGLSFHFIIIKAGRSASAPCATNICSTSIALLIFPICFSRFLVGSCPCVLVSSYHPRISACASSVASDRLLPQQQAKPTSIFRDERKMQNIMCICCMCIHYNTGSTIFIDINIS